MSLRGFCFSRRVWEACCAAVAMVVGFVVVMGERTCRLTCDGIGDVVDLVLRGSGGGGMWY